ncbi:MAG: ABC transporter substrate-binding protein [Actinomycetota bacterium]|nr:ABC transporter substrate-binding protein [Actinomycetota bacterium]
MSRCLSRILAIAVLPVLLIGLAACGKGSSGGGETSGGVKGGPGVTAKTITLGVQTDLTGVFAALGEVITQNNRLYWKEQNAKGGVCGRQVKLIVKDHGYDPQTAVTQYRDIAPNVAALQQVVGSPISVALLPTWKRDNMLALLAAWPPTLLGEQNVGIIGASYDVEAINGIDWLMKNKGLKKGDKIGDLYFEGDYGEGGLVGVKYAAQKAGLQVVEQKIKATDTDMSGQVAAFKRAGVKAMWLTVGPKQLASAAGVAKASGLDVPIGGNGPVFSPQLLATAVGPTLVKNLTVFGSTAPISYDKPAVTKAASQYKAAYPKGVASVAVTTGIAESELMKATLDKACQGKDLSRENIVKSFRSISGLNTGGLLAGTLDYTQLGKPATQEIYVSAIDKKTDGGEKVIDGPLKSVLLTGYKGPAEG